MDLRSTRPKRGNTLRRTAQIESLLYSRDNQTTSSEPLTTQPITQPADFSSTPENQPNLNNQSVSRQIKSLFGVKPREDASYRSNTA